MADKKKIASNGENERGAVRLVERVPAMQAEFAWA